jgi:hypothetical protein
VEEEHAEHLALQHQIHARRPLWQAAYADGSWKQKLDWTRHNHPDRHHFLPQIFDDQNLPIILPATPTLQYDSEEDENNTPLDSIPDDMFDEDSNPDFEYDHDKTVARVVQFANTITTGISKAEIRQLLDMGTAVTTTQPTLGIHDAIQWANGFEIPESTITQDEQLLHEHLGNWETLTTSLRTPEIRAARLNQRRINEYISRHNQEKAALEQLVDGFHMDVPPGWRNNTKDEPPNPGQRFMQARPAVLKMLFEDFKDKGFGLFIPLETARQYAVNLSPANWTVKEGKAKGRPIWDYSRITAGHSTALNNPLNRNLFQHKYGVIKHPTIDEVALKFLGYWSQLHKATAGKARRAQLHMWKCDLSGAFTLLWAFYTAIPVMGLYLGLGLVWISFVGNFGWAGMPYVFDIVTRACRWQMNQHGFLRGAAEMYSDDSFGIAGTAEDALHDLDKTMWFFRGLLGDSAVNLDKKDVSRVMDILGYRFNLNSWTLCVKPSNLKRTLLGFFAIEVTTTRLTTRDCQRLGSWASRYAKCCPFINPWVRQIWREVRWRNRIKQHLTPMLLTTKGQSAVLIIRAFLLCMALENTTFNRNLDSFHTNPSKHHTLVVEYDASLTGVGVVWYTRTNGIETPHAGGAFNTSTLGFARDPRYQNKAEFIAGVIGVVGTLFLNVDRTNILLRGDSKTALSWVSTWKFDGDEITRAACVYILLIQHFDVVIARTEHIAGVDNVWADRLSRVDDPKADTRWKDPNRILSAWGKERGSRNALRCQWEIEELLLLIRGEDLTNELEVSRFFMQVRSWLKRLENPRNVLFKCTSVQNEINL